MAFYKKDPKLALCLKDLINRFEKEGRPGLSNNIAINWIQYKTPKPFPESGVGASWNEQKLFYPASIVKLFYAVAVEHWLRKDLIIESNELRKALYEMIQNSSNDATSFLIDLLTGTSSGPVLKNELWKNWKLQRNLINNWIRSFNWPEMKTVNCCQKTWEDSPYGREKKFYGCNNENRNALSTEATARFLESLMTDDLLPPISSQKIKNILSRSLNLNERKLNPENQIDGFLGEGLPNETQIWSKAGWMSEARNDAAWWVSKGGNPMLLVVFTSGKKLANDTFLLPAIANELNKIIINEEDTQ